MNRNGEPERPGGRASSAAGRGARVPRKEPLFEQISSFVGFFVWLLVLKGFFIPLFIIPTGSMAETLYGEHSVQVCPNCGVEFPVGWTQGAPAQVQCPNCRWRQQDPRSQRRESVVFDQTLSVLRRPSAGDRIALHGWLFDPPFTSIPGLGPRHWDVVVFKVPTNGEVNYIKRLIGLPGEKIELIDGDVFVNDRIQPKTEEAQSSLWFPYYNHDFPPRSPSSGGTYFPRWLPTAADSGWQDVRTRTPRFEGRSRPRGELLFVTDPGETRSPGLVADVYGYNGPRIALDSQTGRAVESGNLVSDVRVSMDVALGGNADGYVELSIRKRDDRFIARLYADGRVTLEHDAAGGVNLAERALWDQERIPVRDQPIPFSLAVVDYRAIVTAGRARLESTPAQFDITPEEARRRSRDRRRVEIRIAAEGADATLRHIRIDRDVYYTNDGPDGRTPIGTQEHPIRLGPTQYFVLGDNSPSSLDARFAFAQRGDDPIGPHLKQAYREGRYQPGTVEADQLMGRAFLVYWPGFLPLPGVNLNLLPDLGRVRWIH